MTLDTRVLDLVSRWDDLREQGKKITPEELCRDCPELVNEVKRRIKDLQELEPVLDSAQEDDTPTSPPQWEPADSGGGLSTTPAQSTTSGLRYHPLRFHAKGGLGEVFVAHDEELQREVALKRM